MMAGLTPKEQIDENDFLTVNQIFDVWGNVSKEDAFKNEHKLLREKYVVAKICKILGIDADISGAEEPADIALKAGGDIFKIQVVECRNEGSREKPTDLSHSVSACGKQMYSFMGNLDLTQKIQGVIQNKVNKNYAGVQELILAVYVNIRFGSLGADRDELSLEQLRYYASNETAFKEVILVDTHQNVEFLKGRKKIFAPIMPSSPCSA